MKRYDNRYYSICANEIRKIENKKLYSMSRYYLIDDLTGEIVMYGLTQKEVDFFYNLNKMHLFYRKPRNLKQ